MRSKEKTSFRNSVTSEMILPQDLSSVIVRVHMLETLDGTSQLVSNVRTFQTHGFLYGLNADPSPPNWIILFLES